VFVDIGVGMRQVTIKAADRIEALTAENERLERVVKDISDEADLAEQEACMVEDDFVKAEKEIEALTAKLAEAEAKLEKAVEALKVIRQFNATTSNSTNIHAIWKMTDRARTTLAEIEGSNDP
jgi:polyhydroxyalkanoate synthesis regulator phasin